MPHLLAAHPAEKPLMEEWAGWGRYYPEEKETKSIANLSKKTNPFNSTYNIVTIFKFQIYILFLSNFLFFIIFITP